MRDKGANKQLSSETFGQFSGHSLIVSELGVDNNTKLISWNSILILISMFKDLYAIFWVV